MDSYGAFRRWKTLDGGRYEIATSGHLTPEDARSALDKLLAEAGWTPPQWWQFWRWGENA